MRPSVLAATGANAGVDTLKRASVSMLTVCGEQSETLVSIPVVADLVFLQLISKHAAIARKPGRVLEHCPCCLCLCLYPHCHGAKKQLGVFLGCRQVLSMLLSAAATPRPNIPFNPTSRVRKALEEAVGREGAHLLQMDRLREVRLPKLERSRHRLINSPLLGG